MSLAMAPRHLFCGSVSFLGIPCDCHILFSIEVQPISFSSEPWLCLSSVYIHPPPAGGWALGRPEAGFLHSPWLPEGGFGEIGGGGKRDGSTQTPDWRGIPTERKLVFSENTRKRLCSAMADAVGNSQHPPPQVLTSTGGRGRGQAGALSG